MKKNRKNEGCNGKKINKLLIRIVGSIYIYIYVDLVFMIMSEEEKNKFLNLKLIIIRIN